MTKEAKASKATPQRASKPRARTTRPAKPKAAKPKAAKRASGRASAAAAFEDEDETTHFITVDLEIGTRGKLDAIVRELEPRMAAMYRGKIGRLDHANYSGSGGDTIDKTIADLLRTLDKLSPAAKRQWRAAKLRDFNIGIQAGVKPNSLELTASAKTMQAVARLGGRLVITVYAYGFGRPLPG